MDKFSLICEYHSDTSVLGADTSVLGAFRLDNIQLLESILFSNFLQFVNFIQIF